MTDKPKNDFKMRKQLRNALLLIIMLLAAGNAEAAERATQWGVTELSYQCKTQKNPFTEVNLTATFTHTATGKSLTVDGFYDGDDTFRVRFMPVLQGEWTYEVSSSEKKMNGKHGTIQADAPQKGARGMVQPGADCDFIFPDSTFFHPLGSTSYAWMHASKEQQELTYESLRQVGFNKLRFCVFPNESVKEDPDLFPFEILSTGKHAEGKFKGYNKYEWDYTRFNTKFFKHVDECVRRLDAVGVQADLILFHPYDGGRWGFDRMTPEQNKRYLKYVMARLGAYSNIWWSLANEYDLVKTRSEAEWMELCKFVHENDPYRHLCSIHGSTAKYMNYTLPYFTHASIQDQGPLVAFEGAATVRNIYQKPILFDEVCYEGDLGSRWAQLSGEEMVDRIWMGLIGGAYVTHGECFGTGSDHYTGYAFLATGGKFKGTAPARVKFMLSILNSLPATLRLADRSWDPYMASGGKGVYLRYFSTEAPQEWQFEMPVRNGKWGRFEGGEKFKVEIIDTWNMTVTPCDEVFTAKLKNRYRIVDEQGRSVKLPGKPYQMLRITMIED